jgi:hypothetical protein
VPQTNGFWGIEKKLEPLLLVCGRKPTDAGTLGGWRSGSTAASAKPPLAAPVFADFVNRALGEDAWDVATVLAF